MAELRLPKLRDRTPVKVTLSLPPDLNRDLTEYASLYREAYGREEPLQELILAMLAAFLESDRQFVRRQRSGKN